MSSSQMTRPIPIAVFPALDIPHGKQLHLPWDTLVPILTRHRERMDKDGSLWVPALFSCDPPYRKRANVRSLSVIVFDLDDGSAPSALHALDGYEWLCHSSFRSSDEQLKFRVVIPLSEPVHVADWDGFWLGARELLIGPAATVDRKCQEPHHQYFPPIAPPGSKPWASHYRGRWLDPADVPRVAVPERQETHREAPRPTLPGSRPKPGERGDLRTLNIVSLFQSRGHYGHHIEGLMHSVLCPWFRGHSDPWHRGPHAGDAIIQEANFAWPTFKCKHDSCDGRDIRDVVRLWPDAHQHCSRSAAEGAYADARNQKQG